MRKRFWSVLAASLLLLLVSGCTAVTTQPAGQAGQAAQPAQPAAAAGEPVTLRLNLSSDISTLDPNLVSDTYSNEILMQMFVGLTRLNGETGVVEPELATKWDISEDGLTWTFHLRDDIKWSDGKPVTAKDVEYSARRAVKPETASPYAYALYSIKNAKQINQTAVPTDTYDIESLGVKALDDKTVQFTLESPAAYFGDIAGLWTLHPVPSWTIEKYGDKWTDPQNIVVNGPFKITEWKPNESLTMEKNPTYFRKDAVSFDKAIVTFIKDQNTATELFEKGKLDVVSEGEALTSEIVQRLRNDPVLSKQLHEGPLASTTYVGITNTKPPFDNVKVRQAFSAAIDRQTINDTVWGSGAVATQFAPKGIFGAPEPEVGIGYDPAKAKQLLAEAGYPDGKGFPAVTLMLVPQTDVQALAESLQAMWKETLGVEVKLQTQEFPVFLTTTAQSTPLEQAPHLWILAWIADYPDENNWVYQVLHCKDSENRPRASCTKADDLAVQAAAEPDQAKRQALYKQIEQMMIGDEVRIAPVHFGGYTTLTAPFIQRGYPTFGPPMWDTWKVTK